MSKHVSFPASHLSAFELGKRIQVITKDGAKIADTLTKITATVDNKGVAHLYLNFENVGTDPYNGASFEVALDQFVKRIDEDS